MLLMPDLARLRNPLDMRTIRKPRVREIFIPDPGYVLYDCDLSGADARVVAWEADEPELKAAFKGGMDVHNFTAEQLFGEGFTKAPGTNKTGRKGIIRKKSKIAVHLSNYGGKPPTLALSNNWTIQEATTFQTKYFNRFPRIREWHRRTEETLQTSRRIGNKFGFRIPFFDRPSNCFTDALAWTPQSTVALATYYAALQVEARWPQVEMLLQVHDSLVFQVPKADPIDTNELRRTLEVVIPYDDPLVMPWTIAVSDKSWGECQEVK